MARLHSIEMENFKSFSGRVHVGPFDNFTAVVGANGAGKSNIMDAICFALGTRTQVLRGEHLGDLIYRPQSAASSGDIPQGEFKAIVKLVCTDRDGREHSFQRSAEAKGSSVYNVDGQRVTCAEYENGLTNLGLQFHTQNFMIFQNEVDAIASKTPKQLSSLIENLSGSAPLKSAYEAARSQAEKAETNTTFLFRKRKGLSSAKKQLQQQREEADRFKDLKTGLARLHRKNALFVLYHLECQREDLDKKVAQHQSALVESIKEHEQVSAEEKTFQRELATLRRDEARTKKQRAEVTKTCIDLEVEIVSNAADIQRQAKLVDQDTLERARRNLEQQKREQVVLDAKLSEVVDALDCLKCERDNARAEHQYSAAALQQYHTLKEESDVENHSRKRDLITMRRTLAALQQRLEITRYRLEDLRQSEREVQDDLCCVESKILKDKDTLRLAEEVSEKDQNQRRQRDLSLQEYRRQHEDLNTMIENLRREICDKKMSRDEKAIETKMDTALQNMRILFPGLKGRLCDLCRPSHDKYRIALSVIFGRLQTAMVVDTDKTAEECIYYLREQRIGVCVFLPLSSLRPKQIRGDLRSIGGSARMAVDVIAYDDDWLAPVVRFAAGSAILCDSLDEARELRFGEQAVRTKICALDGSMVAKNGFITGGSARTYRETSKTWNQRRYEELKKQLSKFLGELHAVESKIVELNRAQSSSAGPATSRCEIIHAELQAGVTRKAELEEKLERCRNEIEDVRKQVEELNQSSTTLESQATTTAAEARAVKETIFKDFLQRLGIDSIEEAEEHFQNRDDRLSEQHQLLERQRDKLESQLAYLRSRDLSAKIAELENINGGVSDKLIKLREERKSLAAIVVEKRQVGAHLDEMIGHSVSKQADASARAESCRKQCRRLVEASNTSKRALHASTEKLKSLEEEQMQQRLHFQMAGVELPGLKQAGSDDREQTEEQLDFSQLTTRDRLQAVDKRECRARELREDIERIEEELHNLAPNLRAFERLEELEERVLEANRVFELSRSEALQAKSEFERIRGERKEKFLKCFGAVAEQTGQIYKQLTQSSSCPQGGTAYLSLEHQEDPFLRGIKFHAMPPTKRFRDMEQLSGGERTLAALALLFAIHDFNRTPFFIMDEADAALDNRNVECVSAYIRARSATTQVVVISLKDTFFHKADVLIGVYRDHTADRASRVLTYRLPADQNDQHPAPNAPTIAEQSYSPSES